MGIKNELISFRGLTPQIDLTKCPNTGGDTGEGPPIYEVGGYAINGRGGIMLITLTIPPPYELFVTNVNYFLIFPLRHLIASPYCAAILGVLL
jgi:hypothetical protein